MKRSKQVIITTSICMLFIASGYAKYKKEASELTKLRREYMGKAQSEISPINERYAVLLERLEKSFLRSGDTRSAAEVRLEKELIEKSPAHLLTYEWNIVSGQTTYKKEASELTNLRRECLGKAQSEISPINERYAVLLERLEKSFLRSGDTRSAAEVRLEIELFEISPAHLLTYKWNMRDILGGKYENHQHDNTDNKNAYHFVEIKRADSESLKWTNRNGNEWKLIPTDHPLKYNIGKDCSYYKKKKLPVVFVSDNGRIIGVRFMNEYYKKQTQFSD